MFMRMRLKIPRSEEDSGIVLTPDEKKFQNG